MRFTAYINIYRNILRLALGFLLWITLACSVTGAKQNLSGKPNILLIISDDQGFCELGSYMDFADPETLGAKDLEKWIHINEVTDKQAPIDVCFEAARKCMPNIDAIAAGGMRFTDFHAAPTCAPSRTALMSACYPQRFGVTSNDDIEGKYGKGVPAEVDFPIKLFKEAGYLTGLMGKWHLGSLDGQHPNDKGFDHFFGFDRAHVEKYNSTRLYINRDKTPAVGWLADQTSDEAVKFLKIAEKQDKPFFLYVAYNEPHGPIPRPPQKYIDAIDSGSDVVDVYFATIFGMDAGIGRILKQLESMGELDNTLILYGSDNGQARGPYHSGFRTAEKAYFVPVPGNGPFSGCKWTPWEGGVRVPFIAKLPDGKQGSSDRLVSIMDVMPTALDYAGIEVPAKMKLDGQSFLSVLTGDQTEQDGRILYWALDSREPYGNFGPAHDALLNEVQGYGPVDIRSEKHPPGWYVRTEKWKLMGWDLLDPVLIDMENDLGERHDLSDKYPEIVQGLKQGFKQWLNEQANPLVYPETQWSKLKKVGN